MPNSFTSIYQMNSKLDVCPVLSHINVAKKFSEALSFHLRSLSRFNPNNPAFQTNSGVRVCRHLSKGNRDHASVNSHIYKKLFPTCFDTAARVADTVSLFFHIQLLI